MSDLRDFKDFRDFITDFRDSRDFKDLRIHSVPRVLFRISRHSDWVSWIVAISSRLSCILGQL